MNFTIAGIYITFATILAILRSVKGNCKQQLSDGSMKVLIFGINETMTTKCAQDYYPSKDDEFKDSMICLSNGSIFSGTICKNTQAQVTDADAPKAWIFDPTSDNQTVIEFYPEAQSFTPLQRSNPFFGIMLGQQTQNEDFAAVTNTLGGELNVTLFDKTEKNIVALVAVGDISVYDYKYVGLSDENVILLSKSTDTNCLTVNVFSPKTNVFVENNLPMKKCRDYGIFCMASLRTGDVYIFGGFDYTNNNNNPEMLDSERYSASSNTMEAIADLPGSMPVDSGPYCIASEYRGKVMVCDNDENVNQDCYLFDPESSKWEIVGAFLTDRSNYALVEIGEDLYAIGGDGVDSIERYNNSNKSWEIFMTTIDSIDYSKYVFSMFV